MNHRLARFPWIIPSVLLIALTLRLAVVAYYGDTVPLGKDETSYSVLASRRRLRAGRRRVRSRGIRHLFACAHPLEAAIVEPNVEVRTWRRLVQIESVLQSLCLARLEAHS